MNEQTIREYIRKRDIYSPHVADLPDGKVFIKSGDEGSLSCEAEGLETIRATGKIYVPEILLADEVDGRFYLATQYIEDGGLPRYEEFGRNLAMMHMADAEEFGFPHDNYIGAGYQVNTHHDTWISFFRECRLRVQFERAERYFVGTGYEERFNSLLKELDSILCEPEYPSLLHGDLWGGNYVNGPGGHIYLIDPAVYYGHREADMAMTELFGGFPESFYRGYHEVIPEEPGYRERRDVYNLYHLLNHLNIFGSGYLGSVKAVIDRYTRR